MHRARYKLLLLALVRQRVVAIGDFDQSVPDFDYPSSFGRTAIPSGQLPKLGDRSFAHFNGAIGRLRRGKRVSQKGMRLFGAAHAAASVAPEALRRQHRVQRAEIELADLTHRAT